MGLVKQCITSMYKKNIQRLTKVSGFIFTLNHCPVELEFLFFEKQKGPRALDCSPESWHMKR